MAAAIDAITIGSGGGIDTSDADAISSDILASKTAYVNDVKITGTMVNNGAVSETLNAGENYIVPQGYHDGSGIIEAASLSSQTIATATASDIKQGQTAYVNGLKISGAHVCEGLEDMTADATAIETDILSNKTAYANGTKLTGSMVNNGAISKELNAGENYTIPIGYHDGSGIVSATSLSSQTVGTAKASDILSGKTAYVNGAKLTGTYVAQSLVDMTSDATATTSDILSGKTAYVNGSKITGTIVTKTNSDLSVSANTVTVPAGYYVSEASKSVATATQATPTISVSTSGLITASSTQSVGYVSAGTKSATKQLTTQAAQTITPSTTDKTISSGVYLTGTQTIKGDSNLVASNIVSGKSIFGVTGSATTSQQVQIKVTNNATTCTAYFGTTSQSLPTSKTTSFYMDTNNVIVFSIGSDEDVDTSSSNATYQDGITNSSSGIRARFYSVTGTSAITFTIS